MAAVLGMGKSLDEAELAGAGRTGRKQRSRGHLTPVSSSRTSPENLVPPEELEVNGCYRD